MAKKADQMQLSFAEQEMLSEALNLLHHGQKRGMKKLIMMAERLIHSLDMDARKSDAIAESMKQFVPDEDFPVDSVLDQAAFIEERFYSTTGTGGAEVMFVRRHNAQKADELINRQAGKNLLQNRYGEDLHWVFQLFWHLFPPATVSREYVPNGGLIVQDDFAQFANTWVPPTIKPTEDNQHVSNDTSTPPSEKRPDFWQQYLDRLMPKQHLCWWTDGEGKRLEVLQQDFFEAWLAQRVCCPIIPNNISVVLRGNFGTGKGFWLDVIAKELVGMANYQPVTTKAWKGDFNGDLFDSVIIHLEETNDTRANTADMLKMLVTQDRHRANVKNLPQKFVQKHFAIAISSNHFDPIKIDEHDRRYFVPAWSDHLTGSSGKSETAAFFEEFSHWLNMGGFQEMRDWFEQVDVLAYNFRVAPDTDAKQEICIKDDPSESRKSQLALWLIDRKDQKVAYTSAELMKSNPFMTTVQVQAALRQAGYVWIERSFNSEKRNLWVPSKHKDVQLLARNNWSLYQHNIDFETELNEDK